MAKRHSRHSGQERMPGELRIHRKERHENAGHADERPCSSWRSSYQRSGVDGFEERKSSIWSDARWGGIAGIVTQTPLGALVDFLRSKRAIVSVGVAALAAGALVIALSPSFGPVMSAQVLIGGASSVFIPAVSLGIVGRGAFDDRQGRK